TLVPPAASLSSCPLHPCASAQACTSVRPSPQPLALPVCADRVLANGSKTCARSSRDSREPWLCTDASTPPSVRSTVMVTGLSGAPYLMAFVARLICSSLNSSALQLPHIRYAD